MAVRRQRHLAELLAVDAGDAVVLGQPAVEHGEVGGDEVRQAQVVLQHLVEEQLRLLDHRHLQHVVEFGVEDGVGRGGVDVAQAEPLADEVLGERRRLGVLQHALDLLAERVGLVQFPLLGEREQFLVGHRAPQEVGQPAGQGEVVELAGLLAEEQEVRRHQHGLEADAHRLLERVLRVQLGLHAGQERLDVLVGHGPPEGAAEEVAEDALGIGQRLLRDDLQAVLVLGVGAGACGRSPKIRRWLGGGQVSCSGPSISTHCTASPGPL